MTDIRTQCSHCTPRLRPRITRPTRCNSHPAGAGCSQRSGGGQLTPSRGAAAAPEPSREPSTEPPAASTRALETPAAAEANGSSPVSDFFTVLGDGWRLTATQQARLSPAVSAALSTGWTPDSLAAFTGANTTGVHNPLRDPGRPALPRRTTHAAHPPGTAALVRPVRPGHPHAGLPRRRPAPLPPLQKPAHLAR